MKKENSKIIKNILVTGGAGYIGSTLIRLLLCQGYKVIVFDDLLFGGESLLGLWQFKNFKFIKGNIVNLKIIESALSQNCIDVVVHLAAIVGDPACAKEPALAKKVNYEASCTLLDLAIKHKVKRFIFASTCSNYGKMPDVNSYVDESSPLMPVSLYAELKVKFEKIVLGRHSTQDDFVPTVLRFATVYGVSPRMRFDLTVNEFTKELCLGRELKVFGEQFWRPYCHVEDIARAVNLVLNVTPKKVAYNVFNVGDTQENYQKRMIIEKIKKFIPDTKVTYIHKDEDPRDYRVSFKKIKNELGFVVSKKLDHGIQEIKSLIDNGVLLNLNDAKYKNS